MGCLWPRRNGGRVALHAGRSPRRYEGLFQQREYPQDRWRNTCLDKVAVGQWNFPQIVLVNFTSRPLGTNPARRVYDNACMLQLTGIIEVENNVAVSGA